MIWPDTSAVNYAKDADEPVPNLIGSHIAGARNDQLAGAVDSSNPSALGEINQPSHRFLDAFVHRDRSTGIVSFDIAENLAPVGERMW